MKKLTERQQRFVDALDNLNIIDEIAEKEALYLMTEDPEIVETAGTRMGKDRYERDEYYIEVHWGYYCPEYVWKLKEKGMIDESFSSTWLGDIELSISTILAYLGNSYDKIRKIEKATGIDLDNTFIYRNPILSVYYIRKELEGNDE